MIKVNGQLSGEQALALGAWLAGVQFVTGYPGTPSKGVFEHLRQLDERNRGKKTAPLPPISFHWAPNEKIALELAVGVSLAGLSSLVCVKSVGANVLLDTIMTVNLTGVPSPLVLIIGDDPSAWNSQNEQDSRWLAKMSELPLLEPLSVSTSPSLMQEAFFLSSQLRVPVVVRFTKPFSIATERLEPVQDVANPVPSQPIRSLPSVASGGNAVTLRRRLHQKIKSLRVHWDGVNGNQVTGQGTTAVIAVGFLLTTVRRVFDHLRPLISGDLERTIRLVGLQTVSPLPIQWLLKHLSDVEQVLVVEEGDPIVETEIAWALQSAGTAVKVLGKRTGHLPDVGQLTERHVGTVLANLFKLDHASLAELPDPVRPQGFHLRFCDGCPYPPFLEEIKNLCAQMGWTPVVGSDPGCSIVAIGKPFELITVKHSMGSAVNIISGLARFERDPNRRYIAIVGDSDFFHGAVIGIFNSLWWRAPVSIIIVDNGGPAYTGGQAHPGSGFDAEGRRAEPMAMENILSAVGAPVRVVSAWDGYPIREGVDWVLRVEESPRILIVRGLCPYVPVWTDQGLAPQKREGKIVGE